MKLKVLNLDKTETKTIDLPIQFYEPVRTDLIRKAFLVIQSNKRQPYGASPEAGKRASAELSRRRRKYRGSYGAGISRVPRKILSRRGTRFNWVGAFAPGTVGGRRAHPPKADKIWAQKINTTEKRKAIRSAIAATVNLKLVKERGHTIPTGYPFIVADNIDEIKQTKKLSDALAKLGFKEEIVVAKEKDKRGLLIVTTSNDLYKSCSNIPGFETINVANLNVESLAPGGIPGRLTLFTQSAIAELAEKQLFTQNFKGEKIEKKKAEPKPKSVKETKKKAPKKEVKSKPVLKKELETKKVSEPQKKSEETKAKK